MLPITRRDIEILLDSPDRTDYVVSAYADMRVKDGFRRYLDAELRNQARAAHEALANAEARKALDANLEAIQRAVEEAEPSAKGLAVFTSAARGLQHAVPLDFPVENRLVIDAEPHVLPLLERWFGEPSFLVVVTDSHHIHLFEAHAGVPEPVEALDRDVEEGTERDRSRFNYKKRFSQGRHERLQTLERDGFLKEGAERVAARYKDGNFAGLILLGPPATAAALRRLLPKELESAVIEEGSQAMTSQAEDVADDVERAVETWRTRRRQELLEELEHRWKEKHRVADGPTDVLDALQQGRAAQVLIGTRRDISGARCGSCGYRFGAPVGQCTYCQGVTRPTDAVQEILRMALRHRVPVHLFERNGKDPLDRAGGVVALLRAEANWAPDPELAKASQGHEPAGG